jgi:hypothetical protein
MFSLVTTRFNSETLEQNAEFRSRNPAIKCIYGCPNPMAAKIPLNATVFVIEMNNTLNQVAGIGLIKNYTRLDRYVRLYNTGNYNRYVYKGQYRLNREDIDASVLEVLDHILFRGKSHMKRGSGFKEMPVKLLKHEMCGTMDIKFMIKDMFIRRFKRQEPQAPAEQEQPAQEPIQ